MLSLFTGLPGSGKTLNLIKYVHEFKPYQGRKICYFGINGLDIEGWTELTEDQVHKWYELEGSPLILIDEVQVIWRQRGNSSKVPFDVQQLETHRHLGIDIMMTCQRPMQIDHDVRGLVQQHWHYDRVGSFKNGRVFKFERCISDPYKDNHLAVSTERYSIDKKYFDCYKSAEVHTHGSRVPKKLYIVIALVIMCLFFFYYAFDRIINKKLSPDPVPVSSGGGVSASDNVNTSLDEYLVQFDPRHKLIPFSQPFYDGLVTPTSYPYIKGCQNFKINSVDDCTCHSMQGVKLDVPTSVCLSFIDDGAHDFTVPDEEYITAMNVYLPTGDPCCSSGSGSSNPDEGNSRSDQ